ncbi:MAG TPA: family 16 glycoside hydrolase [Verrucomicrobiae bacterium]|nr:family 16 glycoside hydrolase [Verrucomicrobiae bacterium]
MRFFTGLLGLLLALSASAATLEFNFADYEYNSTPTNFQSVLFGGGSPPVWKIISAEMPSAFSPLTGNTPSLNRVKVLAQTGEDMTDEHFPMFIYPGDIYRNFKFSTKFKIVSGITEEMAGIAFRFQNVSNFYVVRVSAAGHNVRFYKVVNGVRSDPIGPTVDIPAGQWHKLGVQCEGNQITLYLDDKIVMPTLGDNTFTEGKVGFWTKSDSLTYFSDAVIDYTPRVPPAQQMVDAVMAKQSRLVGLRIYTLDDNSTNSTHIVASNIQSEIGEAGGDPELGAIQNGVTYFGRDKGINNITMPLHDRNGDFIGAVRIKSKSFFGETQDSAVTRATVARKLVEEFCITGDELRK